VYVASQVATVLRFEQLINPDKTRMLGWDGRFEPPLACGKFAVLMPLQEVTAEDRFMLLVTLQDGAEVPLTVTGHNKRVDQQVNVFLKPESPEALRAQHEDTIRWMRKYKEENERLRKEQNSTDHAYASLLAGGAAKDTPFHRESKWRVELGGAVVDIYIYSARKLKKAAVLFHVTNRDLDVPWSLKEVQLSAMLNRQSHEEPVRTGEKKAFALRTNRDEIPPGESGSVAVVADKSAFASSKEGPVHLVLELFRHDGLQQAVVLLDHRIVAE
jgi:hypothetical protein